MPIRFQRGVCRVCQLAPSDLSELTEWRERHLKLKKGMLRAAGLDRWRWYYHFRGKCAGRFPYWRGEEWERRKREGERHARFQWRPGQSGGGNRKGHPDKRPRRKPDGIKAAIIAERKARAEQLERVRLAAIKQSEDPSVVFGSPKL